jgi:hypothetical protein
VCLSVTMEGCHKSDLKYKGLSAFMTYGLVTRLTRRVPLVEQEILTLPEHPGV